MSKWKRFKLYIFCLGAVLVGAGFLDQLIKIQEFKRKARMTKDPMMLSHHPYCNLHRSSLTTAKCNCYMVWVNDMRKEFYKLKEEKKKIPEIW